MSEESHNYRQERVDEIFAIAVEMSTDSRRSFLAQECLEDPSLRAAVERLLAADGRASEFPSYFVSRSSLNVSEFFADVQAEEMVGKQIGPYVLV